MLISVEEKTGLDFKPEAGDEAWLPVEDFLDKPVAKEVLLDKKMGKKCIFTFFPAINTQNAPQKKFYQGIFFLDNPGITVYC